MGDYFSSLGAREGMVSEFDTSLGLRLDYEACLAYLLVPPLGPIFLLIAERKSDYVRYGPLLALVSFRVGISYAVVVVRLTESCPQVPCVAVWPALYGAPCGAFAGLMVSLSKLGVRPGRFSSGSVAGAERVPGRGYVGPVGFAGPISLHRTMLTLLKVRSTDRRTHSKQDIGR
jgi:hypothetical protein